MRVPETLLEARWIVPVEPAGLVLDEHTLVVADGRIAALLPRKVARTQYPDVPRLELHHHALFPGLVNAHTHAAMSLLRGYADDLPLMVWLRERIWPAERAWVGPDFVRDGAQLAVAEMIKGGITTFADQYFFPEETAKVARQAGIRARLGIVVIDFPTAYAEGPDDYLAKGLALHDACADDALVSTMFAPHATYTVSDGVLQRIAALAAELDLPVHIHLHETAAEVADAVAATGERPLAKLAGFGLVNPSLVAVHMTQLLPDEIELLAETGAHVVHCPQSNMKLASGLCPVAELRRAGVNVALGTDSASSNNDLDLIDEMRTAALLAKAVAADAAALPAHEALRMATLAGAIALGLAEEIGSLLPGKSADVMAVNLDDIATTPVHDPAAALVYSAGRHQVSHVWVAGRALLAEGKLLTMDETAIKHTARQWQMKIA